MKISRWIDQFLIYDEQKLPRRVMFICLFTGPLLNLYLLNNPGIEVPVKLNLSVAIYISTLGLIYFSLKSFYFFMETAKPEKGLVGRFLIHFTLWMLALSLTSWWQYEFVYEPILHCRRPENPEVVLATTTFYAFVFSSISEYFRIDLERFKN